MRGVRNHTCKHSGVSRATYSKLQAVCICYLCLEIDSNLKATLKNVKKTSASCLCSKVTHSNERKSKETSANRGEIRINLFSALGIDCKVLLRILIESRPVRSNRPFPSCVLPLFQNEAKCKTFEWKLICSHLASL